MSYDEQPDGDPHGECALEINRLEARITELEACVAELLGFAGTDKARIAELEAENARLRAELDEELLARIALRATNAKMRKCLEGIEAHHESKRDEAYKFGYPQGEEYHTERRDFAREGLK